MSYFKRFNLIIFGVIILTVLVTLGLDLMYRQRYDYKYSKPESLLPNQPIDEPYKLVVLGNSHSGNGISFDGYNIKALNLSGAGQRLIFDLALLKQYRAQIDSDALIIINVSPISFSNSDVFNQEGIGRNYYGRLSPILIPYIKLGEYIESVLLPFVQSGYKWREQYNKDVTDVRSANEKIQFKESENKELSEVESVEIESRVKLSEAAEDTTLSVERINKLLLNPIYKPGILGESVNFMYTKWHNTEEFNSNFFEQNREDLERIIKYSQQQGWRPVLITIPVSFDLKNAMEADYFQINLYDQIEMTDLQNSEYFDFSKEESLIKNSEWFANSDHFNEDGAISFSYVLLQKLIEKGYLDSSVDNYSYINY